MSLPSTKSRLRLPLSILIGFMALFSILVSVRIIRAQDGSATEYEEITRPNIEGQNSNEYIEAGRLWQSTWGKDDRANDTRTVLRQIVGLYSQIIQNTSDGPESELLNSYINRGVAYHRLGSYQLAIEDYDVALSISPNLADALKNRGLSYEAMGQYQEALRDFELFLTLIPQDARPEEYQYFSARIHELQEEVGAPTSELAPDLSQFS